MENQVMEEITTPVKKKRTGLYVTIAVVVVLVIFAIAIMANNSEPKQLESVAQMAVTSQLSAWNLSAKEVEAEVSTVLVPDVNDKTTYRILGKYTCEDYYSNKHTGTFDIEVKKEGNHNWKINKKIISLPEAVR